MDRLNLYRAAYDIPKANIIPLPLPQIGSAYVPNLTGCLNVPKIEQCHSSNELSDQNMVVSQPQMVSVVKEPLEKVTATRNI
jgi:hypothetical protein